MSESPKVASIILAGGQGTRLFPLTLNHCKPAVPFGGKYRLIDIPMSNSIHSGIGEIYVIAQFLTGELQHHLATTYPNNPCTAQNLYFLTPEEHPLGEKIWFEGTADAIRKNLTVLKRSQADYFLILSGDQLYNINFKKMLSFTIEKDAELAIAAIPVELSEAKRLGILQIDPAASVVDFHEKPTNRSTLDQLVIPPFLYNTCDIATKDPRLLASMGIYVFKRERLFQLLQEESGEDFGKHLIPKEIKRGRTYAYIYNGYWEDIGTIKSFYDANLELIHMQKKLDTRDEEKPIFSKPMYLAGPIVKNSYIHNSILSDGAVIEAKEISNSIIGPRVHIKKGSVIRDSIIIGSHSYRCRQEGQKKAPLFSEIGENCHIEKAIIDEDVRIGDNVELLSNGCEDKDGEGIFVRSGLIIVSAFVTIENSFRL